MPSLMSFLFSCQPLILLFPIAVYSYSTGAPCVAKHSLQPSSIFHGTTQNLQANPPPYTFFVENQRGRSVKSYVVGKVYTIRIVADDHFRGILLQPRIAIKDRTSFGSLTAGEFISDDTWDSQGIQIQPCQPKRNDSITHTNNETKTQLTVRWKTLDSVGPVQFTVTLLNEQSIFWEAWQPAAGYLISCDINKHKNGIDDIPRDSVHNRAKDGVQRMAEIRPKILLGIPNDDSKLRESSVHNGTTFTDEQTTVRVSIDTTEMDNQDQCL